MQAPARATATVDDLRGSSTTIDTADKADLLGKAKIIAGATLGVGGAAEQERLLGQAQNAVGCIAHNKRSTP
ncbi:hypothetical protein [Bradyrhizobium sp. WSM1743]|uniref:hypothetical protein n=1 Tax=Bradyrhizobium sp. WSM1743 TaxID=318996 RepID=UPI000400E2E7|nr:hypothetical protein [Bradyrhizobium sp. WSM1743]